MKISEKLINRIKNKLPKIPLPDNPKFSFYKGPKDAGQMSWNITNSHFNICSCESMTDLLKSKKITCTTPDDYMSNGYEIGSC